MPSLGLGETDPIGASNPASPVSKGSFAAHRSGRQPRTGGIASRARQTMKPLIQQSPVDQFGSRRHTAQNGRRPTVGLDIGLPLVRDKCCTSGSKRAVVLRGLRCCIWRASSTRFVCRGPLSGRPSVQLGCPTGPYHCRCANSRRRAPYRARAAARCIEQLHFGRSLPSALRSRFNALAALSRVGLQNERIPTTGWQCEGRIS